MYFIFLSIGVLFLALFRTGPIFSTELDDRITRLKTEIDQVSFQNQNLTGSDFSTSLCLKNPQDWAFYIDGLLWRTKMGGSDWAIVLESPAAPQKGEVKKYTFGWDWGFRVAFGRQRVNSTQNVKFTYTHYDTKDDKSLSSNFQTPNGVNASLNFPGPFGHSRASGHSSLGYNTLDFDLSDWLQISSHLQLRPIIGIKSLWLDTKQSWDGFFIVNAAQTLIPVDGTIADKGERKSHAYGIGPKIGCSSLYFLKNHFYIKTRFDAGALYSYFSTRHNQRQILTPVGGAATTPISINMKNSNHHFIPYIRALIGLAWGAYLDQKRYYLDFSLLYEAHYYFRAQIVPTQRNSFSFSNLANGTSQPVFFNYPRKDVQLFGLSLTATLYF